LFSKRFQRFRSAISDRFLNAGRQYFLKHANPFAVALDIFEKAEAPFSGLRIASALAARSGPGHFAVRPIVLVRRWRKVGMRAIFKRRSALTPALSQGEREIA
jgi:hypothetical protein